MENEKKELKDYAEKINGALSEVLDVLNQDYIGRFHLKNKVKSFGNELVELAIISREVPRTEFCGKSLVLPGMERILIFARNTQDNKKGTWKVCFENHNDDLKIIIKDALKHLGLKAKDNKVITAEKDSLYSLS